MEKEQIVGASVSVIIRTILIILGLWFLYLVRDVVVLLFLAIIVVSAIDPVVNRLQNKKVPRALGVLLVYLLLLIIIVLSIAFLIPPLVEQFRGFSDQIPRYSEYLESFLGETQMFFQSQNIDFDAQKLLQDFSNSIASLSGNIFSTTVGVFSGLFSIIVVLVMAFYMSINEDGIKKFFASITPEKHREYTTELIAKIKNKIGKWLQGQLILMAAVFILIFIGLSIAGVPYALALAIFAGILEIIPYIGPIVAAIPAVLIALTVSPIEALIVIGIYWLVQQLENHIIVPQIMKKIVGLNPVAIILAFLIGAKLGGVLGIILAVPVATAMGVIIKDLIEKK